MCSKESKKINVKVYNLVSEANETRFLVYEDQRECKFGLNESVFNSKQEQNYDECRCECEELEDWSSCRYDYMVNACTCMVAEMGHRQDTFNMFRLLMKLKRHLMSVEFLQVQ